MLIKIDDYPKRLIEFNKTHRLPENLLKRFKLFSAALQKQTPSSSEADLFKAFAKNHQLSIHTDGPHDEAYKSRVYAYTFVFRKLFPYVKVESQDVKFKLEHQRQNLFQAQWEVLQTFIKDNPRKLNGELFSIFSNAKTFEEEVVAIRALLDAGATISDEMVSKALLNEDSRFFELLLFYDYNPSSTDFITLLDIDSLEMKSKKLEILLNSGVKIPSAFIQKIIAKKDLPFFKSLLSHHYALTPQDCSALCGIMEIEQALPFIEEFANHGYIFSEEDCVNILSQHFSKINRVILPSEIETNSKFISLKKSLREFPNSRSENIDKLIQLVCPEKKLSSQIFQKMLSYAYSFLSLGYAPTIEDLRFASSQKNLTAMLMLTLSKAYSFNTEEALCVLWFSLSQKMHPNTIQTLLGSFRSTTEMFKAVLDSNELAIKFVVQDSNDPVQVFTEHIYRSSAFGNYKLSDGDLAYAIEKKVAASTLDFLLYWRSSVPDQSLFQKALKENPTWGYLRAFLHKDYRVHSEDFRYACDLAVKPDVFNLLLNYGWKLTRSVQSIKSYPVFMDLKAGYFPTAEDIEYAKSRCSKEVMVLVEERVK